MKTKLTISDLKIEMFSGSLRDEIEIRVDSILEDEDTENWTTEMAIAQAMRDVFSLMLSSREWLDREWMKQIRLIYVQLGIFKKLTQHEIDTTIVYIGESKRPRRLKPDFRMNGEGFIFDAYPEEWRILNDDDIDDD